MFLQKITPSDAASANAEAAHLASVARPGFHERAERHAFAEPARMRIGTHVFQLKTIDISGAGVKLDVIGLGAVARDSSIFGKGVIGLLTIRGIAFPKLGQIRWTNGRQMGFRFDDPIDAGELATLIGALDD